MCEMHCSPVGAGLQIRVCVMEAHRHAIGKRCSKNQNKNEDQEMKRRRFFNTAGEKRKFYNNLRHFGQTRNLGIACLGLLPVLGVIGLVIMCAIAVAHFGGLHAVTAAKGHRTLWQFSSVLGTSAAAYPV